MVVYFSDKSWHVLLSSDSWYCDFRYLYALPAKSLGQCRTADTHKVGYTVGSAGSAGLVTVEYAYVYKEHVLMSSDQIH